MQEQITDTQDSVEMFSLYISDDGKSHVLYAKDLMGGLEYLVVSEDISIFLNVPSMSLFIPMHHMQLILPMRLEIIEFLLKTGTANEFANTFGFTIVDFFERKIN